MINTREQVLERYKEIYPEGRLGEFILDKIEEKLKLLDKDFEDFNYTF